MPDAPVTPPTDQPAQNADPIAPERRVEPSPGGTVQDAVSFTVEQQAVINSLIADRLKRERAAQQEALSTESQKARTLEERLAEVEKTAQEQVTRAEQAAVQAIVERAASHTHNPELVMRAVDLEGLTSADAAEIASRVAVFLNANPYLVKANTPAATPAPTPGATATGEAGGKLLTPEQMRALTAEDLADEGTMRLYLESMAVHGAQPA